MKAQIKIPKGWRRLRRGEIIKRGCRYWDEDEEVWGFSSLSIDEKFDPEDHRPVIRRIKTAKPSKGKK